MKKFLKKNGGYLIVGTLILIFILFTILVGGNAKEPEVEVTATVSEWREEVNKDEYVVTVFAASWCGNCSNFKPVITKVVGKYDFKFYWFEMDTLTDEENSGLTSTFNFENFTGYPYMFVTKNGEFLEDNAGYINETTLIKFLKDVGVIK